MLDEASASLDFETDAQIQDTILREFTTTHTLLCIAHRLRTIIGYSRILVLNKGQVEEFDTPLNLFRQPDSAFREMCAANSITEQDVIDAQERRLVLQKGISA